MIVLRILLILFGLAYAVTCGVAEHRYRAAMEAGDWAAVARAARLFPLSARLREAAATLPALRDEVPAAAAIAALRRELRWRPHEPKLLFWISYQCWRLAGAAGPDAAIGTADRAAQAANECARDNFDTLRRLAPDWPQTRLLGDLLFTPESGGRAWKPEPDNAFRGDEKGPPP